MDRAARTRMRRAVVDYESRGWRYARAADDEKQEDEGHGQPDEYCYRAVRCNEGGEGREDVDDREHEEGSSPDLERAEAVVEHGVDCHLEDDANGAEEGHGEAHVAGLHAETAVEEQGWCLR